MVRLPSVATGAAGAGFLFRSLLPPSLMPIDPYSPCPGGTGKKIKFCCSDLVTELDKVQKMLDGDQRAACLEYIQKLEGKYQERACLLAIKSIVETSLGKHDQAATTLTAFQQKYPDNAVALAQSATLEASKGNPVGAIPLVLRAIEVAGEEISANVYEAIGAVGLALFDSGDILPARALLMLQLVMSRGEDERPAQALMALHGDPGMAVGLKEDRELRPAPAICTCKFEFDVADQKALKLQWKVAVDKFTALIPLAGQYPELWHNLGVLRGYLGDYIGAAEAWHKFASLSGQSDDAIEAEALAQLLERTKNIDDEQEIFVGFNVTHQDEIETRFAADKQLERLPFDPRSWQEEEGADRGPPPRAMFSLQDRPSVATWVGLKREDVPRVLGYVLLFGRQTDRPERLVLQVDRIDQDTAEAALRRVAGDMLGQRNADPEEIVRRRHKVERVLNFDWRLPNDTPAETRRQWTVDERRDRVLHAWSNTPLDQLGGQTLGQVAADPKQKVRALGHVLVWEQTIIRGIDPSLFDELRTHLGLPIPGPIDPATIPEIDHLPAERLYRVEAEKLTDDNLVKVYRRATIMALRHALVNFGKEIIRRPQVAEKVDVLGVYDMLIVASDDHEQSLRYLDEARTLAHKTKQSSARWDLEELSLRLRRAEIKEALRLVEHISKEHIREPGVAEALAQLMMQAGLMDEQGRLRIPRQAEPTSSILTPGGAAAEPGKLVLPGSETAPSGGRSALWVPGME